MAPRSPDPPGVPEAPCRSGAYREPRRTRPPEQQACVATVGLRVEYCRHRGGDGLRVPGGRAVHSHGREGLTGSFSPGAAPVLPGPCGRGGGLLAPAPDERIRVVQLVLRRPDAGEHALDGESAGTLARGDGGRGPLE